jgi:hypothetical protein
MASAPKKGKPLCVCVCVCVCRLLLESRQRSSHSPQRIFIRTHYILWEHSIYGSG